MFFVLGTFVMAFGISLSAKAGLGTSPISSIPYVLSLDLPLTMGTFTILLNFAFILLQIALLRRDYKPIQLLQVATTFLLGFFIDVSSSLVAGLTMGSYLMQWALALLGCLALALGVSMELTANVVLQSGEGMVAAIAQVTHQGFSKVKVRFDVTLVLIAVAISFYLFGSLDGVREGTVAAALLVGNIAKFLTRKLKPFERHFLRGTTARDTSEKLELQPDSHPL